MIYILLFLLIAAACDAQTPQVGCWITTGPFVSVECEVPDETTFYGQRIIRLENYNLTESPLLLPPSRMCSIVRTCPNSDYVLSTSNFNGDSIRWACDNYNNVCPSNYIVFDNSNKMLCSEGIITPYSVPTRCTIRNSQFPSQCPYGYYGQRCLKCPPCPLEDFQTCVGGKNVLTPSCIHNDPCPSRITAFPAFNDVIKYDHRSSSGTCFIPTPERMSGQYKILRSVFDPTTQQFEWELVGLGLVLPPFEAQSSTNNPWSMYLVSVYSLALGAPDPSPLSSYVAANWWFCGVNGVVYSPQTRVLLVSTSPYDGSKTIYIDDISNYNVYCECLPGWFGKRCEKRCIRYQFDENVICIDDGSEYPAGWECNSQTTYDPDRDLCTYTSCPPDKWGPFCEYLCPFNCLFGTKCDQNYTRTATAGTCICEREGEIYNVHNRECSPYHCGTQWEFDTIPSTGLCSGGHGTCVGVYEDLNTYCICKPGYYGLYCENESVCQSPSDPTVLIKSSVAGPGTCEETYESQSCDCGVVWDQGISFMEANVYPYQLMNVYSSASYVIDNADLVTELVDDSALYNNANFMEYRYKTGIDPFQVSNLVDRIKQDIKFDSLEAAKLSCYADAFCDAILTSPRSYNSNSNPDEIYVSYVRYVRNAVLSSNVTFAIGTQRTQGQGVTIHAIRRKYGYRCDDYPEFDPVYYMFESGHQDEIEDAFCDAQHRDPISGKCCLTGSTYTNDLDYCGLRQVPTMCTSGNGMDYCLRTHNWAKRADLHYRSVGGRKRYKPNSKCSLSPVIWSSATKCQSPLLGCKVGIQIPCSDRGRCVINTSGRFDQYPYLCECDKRDGIPNDVTLAGRPEWTGWACEVNGINACINPNATIQEACSASPSRCIQRQHLSNSTLTTTDPFPVCDCESERPTSIQGVTARAAGTGTFCELNRCYNNLGCKTLFADGNECVFNTDTQQSECECGTSTPTIGVGCQINATSCLYLNPTTNTVSQCAGNGVCMPADVSNQLEYRRNDTWCDCQPSYTGRWCTEPACDVSKLEPGNGVCISFTGSVTCYPAFKDSEPQRCNVSVCTPSGGTPFSSNPRENKYYDVCACPIGRAMRPELAESGDITCWPILPKDPITGMVCGNNVSNTYELSGTNLSPTARARCICGPAFNLTTFVDVKTGITEQTCSSRCSVNGIWNIQSQSCDCIQQGGKYYNKIGNTRCEDIKCEPNGDWNTPDQKCNCRLALYNSTNNCETSKCSALPTASLITCQSNPSVCARGIVVSPPFQTPTCLCYPPYTSSSTSNQDCYTDVCGTNGKLNQSTSATGKTRCECFGLWRTDTCSSSDAYCTLNGVVRYCKDSRCVNGGTPALNNSFVCSCPYPYIRTSTITNCTAHVCNSPYGYPSNGQCTCLNLWTGPTCSVSPCENGGVWDASADQCTCQTGFTGKYCKTLGIDCGRYGRQLTSVAGCVCDALWTGPSCNITRCQNGGVYSETSSSCSCSSFYYVGYLCDVYVGPPPTSSPIAEAPLAFQNQETTLFGVTLKNVYWFAIGSAVATTLIGISIYLFLAAYNISLC